MWMAFRAMWFDAVALKTVYYIYKYYYKYYFYNYISLDPNEYHIGCTVYEFRFQSQRSYLKY